MPDIEETAVVETDYLTMITIIKRAGRGKRNTVSIGENGNKVYWAGNKIVALEDMPTKEDPRYVYYVSIAELEASHREELK